MCHYVNGVFCYYQWQETHDAAVAARARQELQSWSEAWRYYQTAVPRLPGVASLYRSQNAQSPDSASGAMAELCEAALQTLAARKGNPDSPQAAVTGSSLPLQPMN
jgi:hypothetical protein